MLHASAPGDALPLLQVFRLPRSLSFLCLRSFSYFFLGLLPCGSGKYGCTDSLHRHSRGSYLQDSLVGLYSLHNSTYDHMTNLYSVQDLRQGRKGQLYTVGTYSLTHLLTYALTEFPPYYLLLYPDLLNCSQDSYLRLTFFMFVYVCMHILKPCSSVL